MTDSDGRDGRGARRGDAGRNSAGRGDAAHLNAEAGRPAVDRARIDAVFGETLPGTTTDEARGRGSSIDDHWWREQRPPHHG